MKSLLPPDLERLLDTVAEALDGRTPKERCSFIASLTVKVLIGEKQTGGQEAAMLMAAELIDITKLAGMSIAEPH